MFNIISMTQIICIQTHFLYFFHSFFVFHKRSYLFHFNVNIQWAIKYSLPYFKILSNPDSKFLKAIFNAIMATFYHFLTQLSELGLRFIYLYFCTFLQDVSIILAWLFTLKCILFVCIERIATIRSSIYIGMMTVLKFHNVSSKIK